MLLLANVHIDSSNLIRGSDIMYEFSTESKQKCYSIFVDQGKVTAVLISDDCKGRIYSRDEEPIGNIFFRAAKVLAAESPQEFGQMRKLIEEDYRFWSLSEAAILQVIRELKSLLD